MEGKESGWEERRRGCMCVCVCGVAEDEEESDEAIIILVCESKHWGW